MVRELGEIVGVLGKADPEDKADLYEALGLRLTYEPDSKKVRAEVTFDPHLIGNSRVSEGGDVRVSYGPKVSTTSPERRVRLVTEFDLSGGDR